jgi:hypothetical protein
MSTFFEGAMSSRSAAMAFVDGRLPTERESMT